MGFKSKRLKDKDGDGVWISLDKPDRWEYTHMIDYLAKRFGQCIYHIASKYTRYDFWVTFLNDVYNNLQETYSVNKK